MTGKESVRDYPRPPAVEPSSQRIRVLFAGRVIADSTATFRVLETSHPPTYYIPRADIDLSALVSNRRFTLCEFKGAARYYDVAVDGRITPAAAWFYPRPTRRYRVIANYVSFYAGLMDECWVDNELVMPQPGDFYGGWITRDIKGPFKGS